MCHPNWFDWLVYRLFRWRWNPIFKDNPMMRKGFELMYSSWDKIHNTWK